MTDQLHQACDHLLQLLDAKPRRCTCNACDDTKTARFVPMGMGEMVCEDCVKNFANLALDAARCSVS